MELVSTVVPSNICMFLSCRPFVVITTLSTGLVGVDNVVITTKSLQDRNMHILDGTTVENKGKLILNETTRSDSNIISINYDRRNKTLWKYHLYIVIENRLPKKIIFGRSEREIWVVFVRDGFMKLTGTGCIT